MKSPVAVVAVALITAILVVASLLIHFGIRKSDSRSMLNIPTPVVKMNA